MPTCACDPPLNVAHDLSAAQAKEILYHKGNLNRIIAEYTGQSLNQVEQDTDRDNYMNPIEARDYGIIDHIVGGEEAVYRVKGSLRKFPKVCAGGGPTVCGQWDALRYGTSWVDGCQGHPCLSSSA